MKINWNTKYTTIAIYSFIIAVAVILFYFAISQMSIFTDKLDSIIVIMQPFIIGFCIAYIVNFLLEFYENKVFKIKPLVRLRLKSTRGISTLLAYITIIFILSLFVQFVVPKFIESLIGLVNNVPTYVNTATNYVNTTISNLKIDPQYSQIIINNFNIVVNRVIKFATDLIPAFGIFLGGFISSIWNLVLGTIISVYLLLDKENLCALVKKVMFGLINKTYADEIIDITRRCDYIFGRFLIGKIIDSVIVGILTFIITTIFKMPYAVLLAVIIGATNVIPFFGGIIGAVPSFVIIFFISPAQALWFIVIVLVIQQIDGNIIGPKILGESIGISPFWILASILIAGKIMGVFGMIVGVPLFTVIYSIVKEFIENKLKKKGLNTSTSNYVR